MCRNIKRLRRAAPPVATSEIEEAARHLVRKLTGFREPSGACGTIGTTVRRLLEGIKVRRMEAVAKATFLAVD